MKNKLRIAVFVLTIMVGVPFAMGGTTTEKIWGHIGKGNSKKVVVNLASLKGEEKQPILLKAAKLESGEKLLIMTVDMNGEEIVFVDKNVNDKWDYIKGCKNPKFHYENGFVVRTIPPDKPEDQSEWKMSIEIWDWIYSSILSAIVNKLGLM